MDRDHGFRPGAVHRRIGEEVRRVQDHELGIEILERRPVGTNEKVTDEQAVPRAFADDADGQAIGRLGAAPEVLHIELLALEIGEDLGMKAIEMGFAHGTVHVAPPDVVLARRLLDDELVAGRPARMLPRAHHEGAALRHDAVAPANRRFVKRLGSEVPVHRLRIADALFFDAVLADVGPLVIHDRSILVRGEDRRPPRVFNPWETITKIPSGICPLACARPRPLPAKFDPNMRGCRRMGFAQASKAAIYWPFPPATGHAPRVKNNRRDRSDMPRIALVDDDQNILTSISMALEAEG